MKQFGAELTCDEKYLTPPPGKITIYPHLPRNGEKAIFMTKLQATEICIHNSIRNSEEVSGRFGTIYLENGLYCTYDRKHSYGGVVYI